MSTNVKDFVNRHELALRMELNKFLSYYKLVSGIELSINGFAYNLISTILGHYIIREYNPSTWKNSIMQIPINGNNVGIEFRYFAGTEYEDAIFNFLEQLHSSFFKMDVSKEIQEFFESKECTFDDEEKKVCQEFYNNLIEINRAHVVYTFFNLQKLKEDVEQMKRKSDVYDQYLHKLASEPEKMRIILEFDKILKQIAINNPPKPIHLDLPML